MVDLVLEVAEPAYCFGAGRITRISKRQMYFARLEKTAHTVIARFSVNVTTVVGIRIEWYECVCPRCVPGKIAVEHLFPSSGMQLGCTGNYTIEIKNERIEAVQSKNSPCIGVGHSFH